MAFPWIAAAYALSGALQLGGAFGRGKSLDDAAKYERRAYQARAPYVEAQAQRMAAEGGYRRALADREYEHAINEMAVTAGGARVVRDPRQVGRAMGYRDEVLQGIEYETQTEINLLKQQYALEGMGVEQRVAALRAEADQTMLAGVAKAVGTGAEAAGLLYRPTPSGTESFSELSARRGYGATPRKTRYPSLATKYAPVKGSGMHPTLRYG